MLKLDRREALGLLAAGIAAPAAAQEQAAPPTGGFAHGVASGDPLADRVIIWTRAPEGAAQLAWEVAEDEGFTSVVQKGAATVSEVRDYTVKVDVTGLAPGREYFYRFKAGETLSPVGRTRTLPQGPTPDVVIAVASCALWVGGFYNAYEAISKLPRVDAVVHLGDYIYEYGPDGYGGDIGAKIGRLPDPPHEILSLDDYRRRHAQAKSDPQLQAAHARAPWIVVWDDHETANDSWVGGAENHQPAEEGDWAQRKANAIRAWYEWMPIREPEPRRFFEAINRSFQFGDLASLIMVETRLAGRDEPLSYQTAMPFVLGLPNIPAFRARWKDPSRELLGQKQQAWLADELSSSVKAGRRWQVLGNQVVMGRVFMPNLQRAMGRSAFSNMLTKLPDFVSKLVRQSLWLARLGLPLNLDAWDGYPAARERVYEACKAAGARPIVLAGDSHAFWGNELWDDAGETRVAVEFGTTGISSPGFEDILVDAPVSEAFTEVNKEVIYTDQKAKGFVLLTLTQEKAVGEYVAVSTIFERQYETTVLKRFEARPAEVGMGPLVETPVAATTTLAAAE